MVTILSSTAMLALMSFDQSASQHRFVETQNKLNQFKKASLETLNYNGFALDVGYVVDNGRLPSCLNALLIADDCDAATGSTTTMQDYQLVTPIYDPTPDSNNFNEGASDYVELDNSHEMLWKGFRPVYLNGQSTKTVRDGWGNIGTATSANCLDADSSSESDRSEVLNLGWCWQIETRLHHQV